MKSYLPLLLVVLLSCRKTDVPPPVILDLPQVTTLPLSNIGKFSADVRGIVTDTGSSEVFEAGFLIDSTPKPGYDRYLNRIKSTIEQDGSISGSFSNLPPTATYYIRSYAKNHQGISYGEERSFTAAYVRELNEHVFLSTQQELNDFAAKKYTIIGGTLHVTGSVTDLSPLNILTEIRGNLIINETLLTTLESLDSLVTIGGLEIHSNQLLENLLGLEHVQISNGNILIHGNPKLASLTGLDNLTSIFGSGSLTIQFNPLLANLHALSNLEHIDHGLYIKYNDLLTDLSGPGKIDSLVSLEVAGNNKLTGINGLTGIKEIQHLTLQDNPQLSDISVLKNLAKVTNLFLYNSPLLTSIDGLSNIQSIQTTLWINNTGITDLNGLQSLMTIENLMIFNNPHLQNLDGAENLQHCDQVNIQSNHSLTGYCSLKSLLANNFQGVYNTYDNATNPTKEEVIANCP